MLKAYIMNVSKIRLDSFYIMSQSIASLNWHLGLIYEGIKYLLTLNQNDLLRSLILHCLGQVWRTNSTRFSSGT